MADTIARPRSPRTLSAFLALLVSAGCTDSPQPGRQRAPGEEGTAGGTHEEEDVPRRGPGTAVATPAPAGDFHWQSFEDAPSGRAVTPAAAEAVEQWISDLGDEDDAVAESARHALLHQGFRVSAQLRVRAAGTDRGAVRARQMTDILGARLRWMWAGRGAKGWTFTTDGLAVLSWTADSTPGLECRSVENGRPGWKVSPEDIRTAFGIPYWSSQRDRFPEISAGDPGKWRVMGRDNLLLDVSESTGQLSLFRATRRSQIPDARINPEFWRQPEPIEVPGSGRARVSGWRLEISRAGSDVWYPDVLNPPGGPTALAGSPDGLIAMTRSSLRTYSWKSLKLLFETNVPLRTWWIDVCPACGRIVIGGTEATAFAVIPGARGPVFRADGPPFSMTAMALDARRRWIATADSEGFVRLFLAGSLERIATARADGAVESLRFSPDGRFLVATATTDATDSFARRLQVFRVELP